MDFDQIRRQHERERGENKKKRRSCIFECILVEAFARLTEWRIRLRLLHFLLLLILQFVVFI